MTSSPLAVITGGTSGIGFGVARRLNVRYDLALVYANDTEKAQKSRNELQGLSPDKKILLFQKDLKQHSDAEALRDDITESFGKAPAVLVNSAGRLRDGLFLGSDFQLHQQLIQEHLVMSMSLCHVFLKGMYSAKFGRIINLSSISAQYSKRGQSNYAAAKAGIEGFTRTLALEVAHRGITVNAIAPGLIETPMTANLVTKIKESGENLRSRIPVGRMGSVDEVGALVQFLCSEDAGYITGTVITIDGGRALGDPQS